MAKRRSPVTDYLVYVAVRFVVCVIQSMSFELACRLARQLAWLVYHINRRHRLVADDNLKHAFPGQYSDAQRDAVVREIYCHFLTLVVEMTFLGRLLHPTSWSRTINMVSGARLGDLFLSGRPVLLVSGHFGNWELGNYLIGLLGFKTAGIARPLDNPYLDAWLRRFREHTGQVILTKKEDYDRIQEVLAQGRILGTLGDQDAGPKGLFVDFFNRPASTHKAVALLAMEFKTPMAVLGVPRVGKGLRYDVYCEDVIDPLDYEGRPDAVTAITLRFTQALERLIRRHPEQYFWLHRRWKHQPLVRKAKQAA